MASPRIVLLRAWPSTALAQRSSVALQLTKGRFPTKVNPRNRNFSVSHHQLLNNTQRYAKVSSHEVPTFTIAKTSRDESVLKPGSDFSFHKVPPCLIPSGWTNDPRELECLLGMRLHEYYTSFPTTVAPVLVYTEYMVWHSFLLCEGSDVFDPDFYLVTFNQQVYRLETKIELIPLLACMKEGTVNVPVKNGEMPSVLKTLLEHPELDWHLLGADEWTDKRKEVEKLLATKLTPEHIYQSAKERAVLKNTREEYVNWVGLWAMARAEKHWDEIREMLKRKEGPLGSAMWDGSGVGLEKAWKEYKEEWEKMEKGRAGREYDLYVRRAEMVRKGN